MHLIYNRPVDIGIDGLGDLKMDYQVFVMGVVFFLAAMAADVLGWFRLIVKHRIVLIETSGRGVGWYKKIPIATEEEAKRVMEKRGISPLFMGVKIRIRRGSIVLTAYFIGHKEVPELPVSELISVEGYRRCFAENNQFDRLMRKAIDKME